MRNDSTTRLQALNVRSHVIAAVAFLNWLHDRVLALGTCAQADLETWIDGEQARYRVETRHFVR